MKKSLSARRVPRKIGNDEDEGDKNNAGSEQVSDTTIKRPVIKPRKSGTLRPSFQSTDPDEEDDSPSSGVVTPKRGANLSRLAVHRNASKRASLLSSQLPTRDLTDDTTQPSYSADALQQLKDSTPSTPHQGVETISDSTQALDLSSKFGTSLARYTPSGNTSIIPSEAEIVEKKARRARLAKEQAAEEYISLDPDDPGLDDSDQEVDERGRLVLREKDKWGLEESRLVRDDEDVMEDFEEFTEDGKVVLGRNAEVEGRRRRREDMERRIREMQEGDSEEEVEERNAVFEEVQIGNGIFGVGGREREEDGRPRTPKVISSLPTLDGVVERLRRQMSELQSERAVKLQAMEELQREKIWLGEEELRIQKALKETAAKFKAMREEKGIEVNEQSVVKVDAMEISQANTPKHDDNDDDTRDGLGMRNPGAGLGF